MHRSSRYFLSFLLIIALFGFYLITHQQQLTMSPASSPQSHVLSAEDVNAQCHARIIAPSDPQSVLPDPNCTPGVLNSAVTQENIYETICHRGFTRTIRPPVSYTSKLKREQIAEYGYSDTSMSSYEEDHYISLELGGSPDDPKNLWPEPHGSPNEKDLVENYLNQQVCDRKMTLAEAQREITTNWYAVYQQISR